MPTFEKIWPALFVFVCLVIGCEVSIGEDESPLPATKILEVRVDPNPVIAGDSTVFTCVIADSLVRGFTYFWNLSNVVGGPVTEVNHYTWKAPEEPGAYAHSVVVERGSEFAPVQKRFEVTVIPKQKPTR
ncbi:hypothetical protein [Rhodocaloribacter sp.]